MLSRTKLRALALLLPLALFAATAGRTTAAGAQIQVVSVDPSAYPDMDIIVAARDANNRGVTGLENHNFVIEEEGHTIPSELLKVSPTDDLPTSITLAVVADMGASLGPQAIQAVCDDARTLVAQLLDRPDAEVGLFVPRGSASDQQLQVLPFTSDKATATDAVDSLRQPPPGATDLYNAVAAAINASADRAAQRNGPAYVVILSDGIDRTSIVGNDAAGANQAATLAEQRHVQVFTLGYGANLNYGSRFLTQLSDRSGGSYQRDPDPPVLEQLAQKLRDGAANGAYHVRYRSALAADGHEHQLLVRATIGSLELAAEKRYTLPQQWNRFTPARLDLKLDTRNYPNVMLLTRPINQLRHTVPDLSAQDVHVTLDNTPLAAPVDMTSEPLDLLDPAASQSVAVVVSQEDASADALRRMAEAFLQSSSAVPSRVALFVPGLLVDVSHFTHDHNAVINGLNQASGQAAQGSTAATLLLAIDAAANDGDAASRPAYVVLFSDLPLMPEEYTQVVTLARSRGVIVDTVSLATKRDSLTALARATEGQSLQKPKDEALTALAQQIERDRATRYRIAVEAPALPDGRQRALTLTIGGQQASAALMPAIAGATEVRPPLLPWVQVLVLGLAGLALVGCGLIPRAIGDRRHSCPSCGKVRRASWGNTCLFCELGATESRQRSGTDVPLEGFALQGAALLQQEQPPALVPLAHEVVAPYTPIAAEAPAASPQAAVMLPPPVAAPAERARVQTHTDFWGSLPDEPPLQSDEPASEVDAPPAADPPPLPIFERDETRDPKQHRNGWLPADVREPTHTDFWGPLPDEPQAAPQEAADEAPVSRAGADEPQAAPQEAADEAPASHTDFWGPLPEREPAQADQPALTAAPRPGAALEAARALPTNGWGRPPDDSHADGDPRPAAVAGEQPRAALAPQEHITRPKERAAYVENEPAAHTDFWGPLDRAASVDE
jgi:hypothetical protein